MAKCDICGKGVVFGIKVSHYPSALQIAPGSPTSSGLRLLVNGVPCHIHACTRCLRSGKVTAAAYRFGQDSKPPSDEAAFVFFMKFPRWHRTPAGRKKPRHRMVPAAFCCAYSVR
jgi:large subunit ribosomal protein L28